jgi:hypothetical protein
VRGMKSELLLHHYTRADAAEKFSLIRHGSGLLLLAFIIYSIQRKNSAVASIGMYHGLDVVTVVSRHVPQRRCVRMKPSMAILFDGGFMRWR